MDRKHFVISWLQRFAIIHGFVMIAVYLFGSIIKPDAVLTMPFLGSMILFSLAGTLPGLVYYSPKEYSERSWWIRTVIHYLLLNALLMPISWKIGLWNSVGGFFVVSGIILLIDVVVHILSFGLDCFAAADINRMLKNRKQ